MLAICIVVGAFIGNLFVRQKSITDVYAPPQHEIIGVSTSGRIVWSIRDILPVGWWQRTTASCRAISHDQGSSGFWQSCCNWFICRTFSNFEKFIRGLGTVLPTKLNKIPIENGVRLHVVKLFGAEVLSAKSKLPLITVERNSGNERAASNNQLPSVLLHELGKCSRCQFCAIVRKHILRLQTA